MICTIFIIDCAKTETYCVNEQNKWTTFDKNAAANKIEIQGAIWEPIIYEETETTTMYKLTSDQR